VLFITAYALLQTLYWTDNAIGAAAVAPPEHWYGRLSYRFNEHVLLRYTDCSFPHTEKATA
jgi:hypothetical protein